MAVKHTFVSGKSDDADTSLVRPSDWNANHTIDANTIGDNEIAAHTTTKITVPDTMLSGTNWTDLTDGGETSLHTHDHGALNGLSDDDHSQYLLASAATDRATFATNWTDLTDGGQTSLHSHAGGATQETDQSLYDAATTAEKITDGVFAGSNITITELAGGDAIQIAATPAGSDTQIQYNASGVLDASADFAWTPGSGYGTISLDGTTGSEIFFHAGGVGYWEVGTDGEIGGTNRDFFINNSQLAFPAIVISGDDNKIQISDFVFSGNPFPDSVNLLAAYNVTSATSGLDNSVGFYSRYTATDGTTSDGRKNLSSRIEYGFGGVGAIGLAEAFHSDVFVQGSGSADNEYAALTTAINIKIGTGYTQTTGPVGRIWHLDGTVLGPIAVQPNTLNGNVLILNNYYNGSPADSPSAGFWLTTKGDSGNGIDATHAAATSYPNDVGIGIVGQSSSSGVGWTKAIQIGGTGSPWGEAASKIGTGIAIQDCIEWGINSQNPVRVQNQDIGYEDAAATTKISDQILAGTNITITEAAGGNALIIAASGGGGTTVFQSPGLRLTTQTGVAVSTSDRTSQGTIYWTPYVSGNVWYYDGAAWQVETISEQSLALTVTSGKNHDVFYLHGTGLVLSSAWTDDTTRADALGTQDGVTVLSSDHTKLWIGTIRASGSNVTEDSAAKRFVWNRYNQARRNMQVLESTDNWSYTTGTWRQANGNSANALQYVTGDVASMVTARVQVNLSVKSNSARSATIGIGVDSTSAPTAIMLNMYNSNTGSFVNPSLTAIYNGTPGLGYHSLNWLEYGADGTCIFYGDNAGAVNLQSGMNGDVSN